MKKNSQINILLVEDSESLSIVYQSYLVKQEYIVTAVETGQQAIDAIAQQIPDIILLDLQLPDMPGTDILKMVYEQQLPLLSINFVFAKSNIIFFHIGLCFCVI